MAEIATIARPYAEALFKAAGGNAVALSAEVNRLAAVAADAQLRQFADNPKVSSAQIFELVSGVVNEPLSGPAQNLLRIVIDNGRVVALPAIAAQFQALVNARGGVSDAVIESAFPIDGDQLAEVVATLETRFGRKLNASVSLQPQLIGGIRVIVGDEVLDTSIKNRLEQMKAALTA